MRYLSLYILLILICSCNSRESDQFVILESKNITHRRIGDSILEIRLPFVIENGYHIQLPNPSNPSFIPTEISINRSKAVNLTKTQFDFVSIAKEGKEFEGIYRSFNAILYLNLIDQENLTEIGGTLNYQTCDKSKCFFPRSLYFKIDMADIGLMP